jgi:signal transduction histidine kinase
MTRRLVVALLVFTAFVLLVSVVPLGVATASRDRTDYAAATRALASSVATLAEDSFDDARKPLQPARLANAVGEGASVTVFDARGAVVVHAGALRSAPAALVRSARAGQLGSASANDLVVAAAPVVADGRIRGVVVVARSDEPVERRVTTLWAALGAVALTAMLLSVALAVGAARWVGRPLRRLQASAYRWSDGDLDERADPATGPPEVRAVAAALNVMAGRLDALVNGSRAVVADVSHQLRTPLAAMRLRLELVRGELAGDGASPPVDEDLAMSLTEIDRLSRLVDGLLAVARAEGVQPNPEAVDVADVVRERRQAWEPVAAERGVTIDVGGTAEPVIASVTPGHLDQVLDNLLDNSLEAMPRGGRIDIDTSRDRDRIVVTVHDDGPGMTPDQQEAAFHRFVTGRGGGTGLGLAVVHRLVTADGGSVRLDSRRGSGTTVIVELPVARGRASHLANVAVDDADVELR